MEPVSKEEYLQHKQKCGISFEAIIDQQQADAAKIDRLSRAVYGDDNGNIGMKAQVNEIHGFFFSTNVIIRTVKNGFLVMAFLSALIYGLIKLWKEFK